jgi:hypothetical protein
MHSRTQELLQHLKTKRALLREAVDAVPLKLKKAEVFRQQAAETYWSLGAKYDFSGLTGFYSFWREKLSTQR